MSAYFENKIVVVTGGSDGIGKCLVESLLVFGARVATCGRNSDKLYDLKVQNPDKDLLTMVADVSREADCRQFIASTIRHFGHIDILINNAGISMNAYVQEADIETLRTVMDINFWGMVYCTKFALPYILESKGDISGVSSIAGYRGLPGRSGYSASKFAMIGWLEALRTEVLESGVNVMWVCPGYTKSNILKAALDKHGKQLGATSISHQGMMDTEECVAHILKAISRRKRTLTLSFKGKWIILAQKFFPSIADIMVKRFYDRIDARSATA